MPAVDFDTKGIESHRISTVHRCIVCGKVVSFDYDYYSDYHKGSTWKTMDIESYVVLDVEGVVWWRDRIVCKKCFRTRKKELRRILYEKAKRVLKLRLQSSKETVKWLRSRIREELRKQKRMKRLLESPERVRWKIEKEVNLSEGTRKDRSTET